MPFARRRADAAALAALALVIIALFADVLFLGSELYFRDVALQYYPSRRVLHDIVRSAHFPFWNPRLSGGQPLAAHPGYEAFYPFQWLILLPDFDLGFRWTVILHLLIAAWGMYALLRALSVRIPASLFGAMSFALGGMMMSLTNLLPFLFSAAWLPWIGFFWHRALRDRRAADVALTALALAMLLLAADESMILQAGALVAAYGVYCAIRRGRWLATAAMTMIVIAAATLTASVQLFPAIELMAHTGRAAGIPLQKAAGWSLGPERLLELLLPNLESWYSRDFTVVWSSHPGFPFPFILNDYAGLLAGVLIVAAFARRVRGWAFVAVCAGTSYLVATGVLFRLLYAVGLHSIRYPEKFFVAGIFILTVFAALAADELDRDAVLRRTAAIVCGAIALVSVVCYAFPTPLFDALWGGANPVLVAASRRGWLLSACASAVLGILLALYTRLGRHAVLLLALFVLVDLGARTGGLVPRVDGDYYDLPPAAQTLAARNEPVRIYNDAAEARRNVSFDAVPLGARMWGTRNAMVPRMEEIWGFGGILERDLDLTALAPTRDLNAVTERVAQRRRDRVPLLLALSGVTDVVVIDPSRAAYRGEDVRQYDFTRLVRFPGNPRFWFAEKLIHAKSADDGARLLESQAAITRGTAFVDFAPIAPQAGRITAIREAPSDVALDVECLGDAFLVVSITADDHWHATIDGQPAALRRANFAFQGVIVPRGRHHIEMRYSNPLVIGFGIVSLVSVVALVAVALRSRAPRLPSPR